MIVLYIKTSQETAIAQTLGSLAVLMANLRIERESWKCAVRTVH